MTTQFDLFGLQVVRDGDASGAMFDTDRVYRYRLWRTLDTGPKRIVWIMLNPSTADESNPDPTMTRVMGFSRRWGFSRVSIVNLFALRSKDPDVLAKHADPIGPQNDEHILGSARNCDAVVCAWGNGGLLHGRSVVVRDMLRRECTAPVVCLGVTGEHQPKHPLYLRSDTGPLALGDVT